MLRAMKKSQSQKISENSNIALKFLSKEILISITDEEPLHKIKKKTYNLINLLNNIN